MTDPSSKPVRLTVMGTTDLHGNVFNWNYFKNTEYDDSARNDLGLAKISTLVTAVRQRIASERDAPAPLLLDAGDTIQGTPLSYYFAKIQPITGGDLHPMAAAMNEIGYDAAALGNHEFNYGLDILREFEQQLRFPLLGANAQDWTTGLPVFPPYVLKRVDVPGRRAVTVGILGLTNPGTAIWDKAIVENKISFGGIVELAKVWVPRVREAGAEVVIVSAHSGMDLSSSFGDALPVPENASVLMAEEVPGIDAVLVGHAHQEVPERLVTNKSTGDQVLLTEPLKWGTPQAGLPVLSIASPFNRAAAIPAGDVSVRDVAGLYVFDNTLIAVTMTGTQVKEYLEFSARYYKQVSGPGPFTPDQVTNAPTPTAPNGTPDYNYDILGGLAKPVSYTIDLARAPGSRITDLQYGGVAVAGEQQFVVAMNNYRQSGSGNFPHVSKAPVVITALGEGDACGA